MIRRLSPVALTLASTLVLAYAATVLAPTRYAATARVLLPESGEGSRLLKIEQSDTDPRQAADAVNARVRALAAKSALVIDEAMVVAQRASLQLNLGIGALVGLFLGTGLLIYRERRRRPVANEKDLLNNLGEPLLAARPMQPHALRALCQQLLEHWFIGGRSLLAIASPDSGDGRSRLAAQLAAGFADLGVDTLLVDADLRSPVQHRLFGLPNRDGLADFLDGGRSRLARRGAHLTVLVAGKTGADPLELLSRARLKALISEAATRYRVVLIDTPAASRGPDLQMFAALAGGAVVLARKGRGDTRSLARLKRALASCASRVVATVLNDR
jgi:Mrp family chromosome partitioning ATPase